MLRSHRLATATAMTARRALLSVAAVSSLLSLGTVAEARLVPQQGDPPAGTGTNTGTAPGATDCTPDQNYSCLFNRNGTPQFEDGICVCYVPVWVPRQVSNAEKGDVGLVPIAGNNGGDPVVRVALGSLGQAHRHSVMFYSNGQMIRHDTMHTDEIDVIEPAIGKVRLDADQLRNGTPGAISQSIDDAFADGSLVDDGLLLKPGPDYINVITGAASNFRQGFEDAVDLAIATHAYYKLSDYTDMTSMLLPWKTSRAGDLKGSHCAGYISWAFGSVGLAIPPVSYDEDIRRDVAAAVHDTVVDIVNDSLDGKGTLGTFAVHLFKPNAAENIANQVVNCFAGLDCASTDPDWQRYGPGDGLASSPDNLLPSTFTLSGSKTYDWNGVVLSPGQVKIATGTTASPFKTVQAQIVAGGYYAQTRLTSW